MEEDRGKKILEVSPAKFVLPLFLANSAMLFTTIVFLLVYLGNDNGSLFNKIIFILVVAAYVYLVLRYYFMDSNCFIFTVYDNGIDCYLFEWSGSSFISFGEIESIDIVHLVYRGSGVFFVPRNLDKYKAKMGLIRKFLFYIEMLISRFNTPFGVAAGTGLDISGVFLWKVCNAALNDYREKHAIKP